MSNVRYFSGLILFAAVACHSNRNTIEPEINLHKKDCSGIAGFEDSECLSKLPVVKLTIYDEEWNHITCSATVVAPRKLLTAAHCFDGYVEKISADIYGRSYQAFDYVLHPKMIDKEVIVYNDVAFVILSEDLPPPYAAIAASFPPSAGDDLFVLGYGKSASTQAAAGELRRKKMKISSIDKNFIKSKYDGTGENTCEGDSGGPAYIHTNGELVLAGIVSTGRRQDCGPGDQTIFINLTNPATMQFIVSQVPSVALK